MTGGARTRKPSPTVKSGADDPNPFITAVRTVRSESGGLLDLMVVRPADFAFVVVEAAAGDPDAIRVLAALETTVKRIAAAPRRSPMRCVACPQLLLKKTVFSFCIVEPSRANPTSSLVVAVCSRCATTPEQIQEKAVTALRQIWPDISSRPITVTHPSGGQA